MHWIFEKANLKGVMLQNLISFFFFLIKNRQFQPPQLLTSVAPSQQTR